MTRCHAERSEASLCVAAGVSSCRTWEAVRRKLLTARGCPFVPSSRGESQRLKFLYIKFRSFLTPLKASSVLCLLPLSFPISHTRKQGFCEQRDEKD